MAPTMTRRFAPGLDALSSGIPAVILMNSTSHKIKPKKRAWFQLLKDFFLYTPELILMALIRDTMGDQL
jgi:hypothetical protein